MKKILLVSLLTVCITTYADNGLNAMDVTPALVGGIDVNAMQHCIQQLQTQCGKLAIWEKKHACESKVIGEMNASCLQTKALMDKIGGLATKVQAIGPITLVSQYHAGDGQYSYHMIDRAGQIINLLWDVPESFKTNSDWINLTKKYPQAGLTEYLTTPDPTYYVPEAIAQNSQQKDANVVKITFQQSIRAPACVACDRVGTANVVYRFSYPEGKFLGVELERLSNA